MMSSPPLPLVRPANIFFPCCQYWTATPPESAHSQCRIWRRKGQKDTVQHRQWCRIGGPIKTVLVTRAKLTGTVHWNGKEAGLWETRALRRRLRACRSEAIRKPRPAANFLEKNQQQYSTQKNLQESATQNILVVRYGPKIPEKSPRSLCTLVSEVDESFWQRSEPVNSFAGFSELTYTSLRAVLCWFIRLARTGTLALAFWCTAALAQSSESRAFSFSGSL